MNQYISSEYPTLLFSTIESAKEFAEKLGLNYEIQKYLFLANDEKSCRFIGYCILANNILLK